jgi:20S proteasome subunit beta 3
VSGTASDKLFGVAEGLWEPDLVGHDSMHCSVVDMRCSAHLNSMYQQEPEDLFETISQTLLNAVDRDAYSGWGAIVHVM